MRHPLSPVGEHNPLGGGFTLPGAEGPRLERSSGVRRLIAQGSAPGDPAPGAVVGSEGQPPWWTNKVWTAGVGRAELGAGPGSRAVLFPRNFPSSLRAFGTVLEVKRRGWAAAPGARPRPEDCSPVSEWGLGMGGSAPPREEL